MKIERFFQIALVFLLFTPAILHGGTWTLMESGTTATLYDVWGSSENDVFAVGEGGTILHYDGSSWTPMNSSSTFDVEHIWGFSSDDVLATGGWELYHYDGNSWSVFEDGLGVLGDIWGTSFSDFFVQELASGPYAGGIVYWNGSTFQSTGYPPTNDWSVLRNIWGTSSSNVYATQGASNFANVLHYDGTGNWAYSCYIEYTPNTDLTPRGIWGSSEDDIFVACFSGRILHYDGSDWSVIESGTQENLYDVWGSSSSDVYAVGTFTAVHYDGNSWTSMQPEYGTFLSDLLGVWGNSSGSEVFAVGGYGSIYHYTTSPVSTTTTISGTTTTSPSSTTTTVQPCPSETLYGGHSEETELLRYLRDNILNQTPEGQEIIGLYYKFSSMIVEMMNDDESFKAQVKEMIDGILDLIME